jgi:hypothetical protein
LLVHGTRLFPHHEVVDVSCPEALHPLTKKTTPSHAQHPARSCCKRRTVTPPRVLPKLPVDDLNDLEYTAPLPGDSEGATNGKQREGSNDHHQQPLTTTNNPPR